ncbi:MAG: sigma-54-dependent Fis family transcriptional regulator [Verrucomicrobiaceae bacterium]|nr:MAG: sigma-54-dependent Fis family transcriptional regulator [Verrucomicrobiaceae bacterium]
MEATVLIVDDEKNTREGLRMALEDDFDVYIASDRAEAMEVLKNERVDVMVTDLRLGADDGMELIDAALAIPHAPVVIMMTAYGSVDTAVEAMKRGAWHFVTKPLNLEALELLIKRALRSRSLEQENTSLKRQVEERFSLDRILGKSPSMRRVFETITQVAPTRATVLIEGESGTGKELVAHAVHNLSGRPKAKLVIVHCAALSPQLLESELFGHEKGSFTGAMERRIGRFEQASGGTLFLDELGEIDQSTQVKLLRALGERTIERVGGNNPIKVDVRVVAATNKDLASMVSEGKFREDLYFRLNVVNIRMPPLRERKEDIPVLAQAFLTELAKENHKPVREITGEALQALMAYNWPGNVRELRTAIEHGVVMGSGAKLMLRHLPATLRGEIEAPRMPRPAATSRATTPAQGSAFTPSRGEIPLPPDLSIEHMEIRLIGEALQRTRQNRSEAAKLLGISRRTLQRKLKELKLGGEDEGDAALD